jgi:hypothetical protein
MIVMEKAAFNKKKVLFSSKLDLHKREKLVKCYSWSTALYGAGTCTLRKLDQKYLASFEMWCWRKMEKTIWTDRVRMKKYDNWEGKANWIGQILRRELPSTTHY